MYTIVPKTDLPEYNNEMEFESLKYFYDNNTESYEIQEFPNSKIFDQLNYGIVILKPIKDQLIIVYNNRKGWSEKLVENHQVLIGKSLNKAFPLYEKIKFTEIIFKVFNENKPININFELYKDKKFVFLNNSYCFREDDLIYIFTNNKTEKILAEQEILKLTSDLRDIQKFSKIFIVTFENETLNFSKETYNILNLPSEEYGDEDLVNLMLPEDYKKIKKLKNNLSPSNPNFIFNFKILTPNNSLRYLKTYCHGKFNESGELTRVTSIIQDITEETLTRNKSLRLTENFQLIEDTSKIGMGEYENGKYTFTQEIYKMVGIKPNVYPDNMDIIGLFVIPEDRNIWLKTFKLNPDNSDNKSTYRIKNANNEIKYIKSHTKGTFNEKGKLIHLVALIQDITEEELTKKEAEDLRKDMESIQKYSKIGIGTFKNHLYSFTSEIYDILEIKKEDYPNEINVISIFLTPEYEGAITKNIKSLRPENPETNFIIGVKTINDNLKYLEVYIKSKFNKDNELIEYISLIQDITENFEYEKRLEDLNEDRKILLQEVHHRVKNNLQLILSFLSLETRFNKNDPMYVLDQTRNRIQTMALTHEEVYKSDNVSSMDLKDFFNKSIKSLFNNYTNKNIKLHLNLDECYVSMDIGIPLGLLVNEVALNTIKYAFPNKDEGNFYMKLEDNNDYLNLMIWDDGVGLPENVNLFTVNSLGFMIIRNLSNQLSADLSVLTSVSGFGIRLNIPKKINQLFKLK